MGMRRNRAAVRELISLVMAILLLVVSGCRKRPENVLSDSEMTDLMVDLIIADAYEQSGASSRLPDSVRRHLGEAVLRQHGVDQATLDSTYAWYGRNLDDYAKLYEKVDKRLMSRARKAGGNMQQGVEENDIWTLPKHLILSPIASQDAFIFQFPAGDIQKGEMLEWKFFMSNAAEADMTLGIDYEDGATSIVTSNIRGDRKMEVEIVSDTARQPKRIFGTLRVARNNLPLWVDSIAMLKQPYDSLNFLKFRGQRLLMGPKKRVAKKEDGISKDSVGQDPSENVGFKSEEEIREVKKAQAKKRPSTTGGYPVGGQEASSKGKNRL